MSKRVAGRIVAGLAVLFLACSPACSSSSQIQGVVFQDRNGNGVSDVGEPGIPNMLVSNGIHVVATNDAGEYALPLGGDFVFVATSSEHTPTTPWFSEAQARITDFGLVPSQDASPAEFVFVQMTDVHLGTDEDQSARFLEMVEEVNDISPDFVVVTGDLVDGADEVTVSEAEGMFDAYSSMASRFDMPLYNALGNHDSVGVNSDEASETDAGYNKEMYHDHFGPTYYSFDWGAYHCLVLDPNDLVDGRQVYQVQGPQLEWLRRDLAFREGRPLLVFYHEPTPSWENANEVLDLLTTHGEASLFCGHWHQDVLLDSQGMAEQVTASVCGEWWFGPCPGGRPAGYRIVSVHEGGVSSLYKGPNEPRQVDIISPSGVVSGDVQVTAQVYSEQGAVERVSYRIDNGEAVPMSLVDGSIWYTANAKSNVTGLPHGYHTIAVEAWDEAGSFESIQEFKVDDDEVVPIGELIDHFAAHQGKPTTIRGNASLVLMGDDYGLEGSGAVVLSDDTGSMLVIVAECESPPPPTLNSGDAIEVTAVPIKYSWDFLTVSQQFSLIQQYASLLPAGLVVSDEAGPVGLLLMRLSSGADLSKLD